MVRACSEQSEALAKVSSSTKTAFLRSSFWSDSKLKDISVRLLMAPFHLSFPFPLSSIFSQCLCLKMITMLLIQVGLVVKLEEAHKLCQTKLANKLMVPCILWLPNFGVGFRGESWLEIPISTTIWIFFILASLYQFLHPKVIKSKNSELKK